MYKRQVSASTITGIVAIANGGTGASTAATALSNLGGVSSSTTLTINGTTYDLTTNRSWSVGTVTSVSALTIGTSGTDISSTVANSTTTPVITLNIPDASASARGVVTTGAQTFAGTKTFSGTVAIANTSPYIPTTYSLDINGGLLVKNIGRTASITVINADPSAGGNNAFGVWTVGGTSATSYVDIQGYYGTSVTGSTTIRLNNAGGNVLVGSLSGTGTRMVVADSTGTLSTQAVVTLSSLSGVPTTRTLTINGTAYDLSADRSWTIAAGVTSFNTRTGAITLSSSDVTTALGYTPYNSTNPNGYISSYTETSTLANVTGRGASTSTNITLSGGTTSLTNGTSNVIKWSVNGVAAPTFNSYSAGVKLVLYDNVSSTLAGYTLGINSGTMFFTVDASTSGYNWYAGTTSVATLSGTGAFTATSFSGAGTGLTGTASSLSIGGNAATVTNATFYRQFTVRDDRSDGNDYSLSARPTGLYAITSTGTNGPGSPYLSLIHVANATDVAFQIAGGYTSDSMYFRGTSALQNGTGYSAWRTVIHSGNYNSYAPTLTGGNASGTWGISISGNAATATNSSQLNSLSKSQLWNNSGYSHGAFTSFSGIPDFGEWFVHQDSSITDGPSGLSYQYYTKTVGLGNDYAYSQYAMQTAVNRYGYGTTFYTWVRYKESGTWQSWNKMAAGYADSAGSASSASTASTVTHYASRADGTYYNVVWAAGNPSYMYSADSVQIQSSTGTLKASVLVANGGGTGWGDVYIGSSSGWGSGSYPTIGSNGGAGNATNSLIMLQHPHVPFLTGNGAGTDSGRASIRMAVDTAASSWWDMGLYGDAFHLYRSAGGGRLMTVDSSGNATFSGSVTASSFSGSLAWGNVSSKPAAWLNATNLTGSASPNTTLVSGFYNDYAGSGNPVGTWFSYVNVRHENPSNVYGHQHGMSFYDNHFWFRSYAGGSYQSWARALDTISDPYPSNMNQYVRTTDGATFDTVRVGNWFRPTGDCGIYFETYGRGLRAADSEGMSYGNVAVYGTGINNWSGYGINDNAGYKRIFMSQNGNFGIYDQVYGHWMIFFSMSTASYAIGSDAAVSGWSLYVPYGVYTSSVYQYSDARAKKNVVTINNALNKVKSLRGVSYEYIDKGDGTKHQGSELGFIAQEVQPIVPEAVDYVSQKDQYAMSYTGLTALLTEAIKEQQTQIESQKTEIEELKDLVKQLINK